MARPGVRRAAGPGGRHGVGGLRVGGGLLRGPHLQHPRRPQADELQAIKGKEGNIKC